MKKKYLIAAALLLLLLLCLAALKACFEPDRDAMAQIGEQSGPTAVLVSEIVNEE